MENFQKVVRDLFIFLGYVCLLVKAGELSELLVSGSSAFVILILLAIIVWSITYKKD